MFNPTKILDNTFDCSYNEFYDCIKDILEIKEVQQLANFDQHIGTSRLDHSLYVSYFAYKWAKKYNYDYKSASRGGLLHDLFLYNWYEESHPEGKHAWTHPKIALRTAKELLVLNKVECDCIEKHMWPLCMSYPKYVESIFVTLADKYSATIEIFVGLKRLFGRHKVATELNTLSISEIEKSNF